MKRRWEKEEIEFLKENYFSKDINYLCKHLNRTKDSIYKKAKRLRITENRENWSEKDIEILTTYWGKKSLSNIAVMLGRTNISIKKKAIELGLGPQCIANGEYLTTGDIAYLLNKNPGVIYAWIKKKIIVGKPFGRKPIYRVQPKEFIKFLKNNPNRWCGYKARIELIKPYLITNRYGDIPEWFESKVNNDRNLYLNNYFNKKAL